MTRESRERWALGLGSAAASALLSMGAWGLRGGMFSLLVIAVHELGHALLMRLLAFKVVGIVFIPGFGGLTLGHKPNASVIEDWAVLLAGPAPGIAIGAAMVASGAHHDPNGAELAGVFLIVNLLNLLPVLPLDGGRLLALLFLGGPQKRGHWIHGLSALAVGGLAFGLRAPGLGLLVPMLLLGARVSNKLPAPPARPIAERTRAWLFLAYALALSIGMLALAALIA